MKVKLGREYDVQITAPDEHGAYITKTEWRAAPGDATRALEKHLRTVRMVLNGEASLNDLGGSYDALQAAPETAALIRKAEEREDGTLP